MAPSTKEYAIGALLIILVDVLWTSSNYLANTVLYVAILTAGPVDMINLSP